MSLLEGKLFNFNFQTKWFRSWECQKKKVSKFHYAINPKIQISKNRDEKHENGENNFLYLKTSTVSIKIYAMEKGGEIVGL